MLGREEKKLKSPGAKGAPTGHVHTLDSPKDIANDADFSVFSAVNMLGNYIHIKVGQRPYTALIDSGSDINVLTEDVLQNCRFRKLKSDRRFITTVENKRMPISFMTFIPLTIGNETVSVKFYVVNEISPKIILGVEFLENQSASVDFKNKKLHFDPRCQLILDKDVIIPPKSEIAVIARIKGDKIPNEVYGLTSASDNLLSTGLMAAKSISKIDQNKVLFGIGNFTDECITLKKNCHIGRFVCLSKRDLIFDVDNVDKDVSGASRVCNVKSTINVKDTNDSLTDKQASSLQALVDEFSDVFVQNGQLGKCTLLRHKIEVPEGTRPVRQRAYKVGPKQKQILEDTVKTLLEQDVIEESVSPWGAPCLLIAKRNNSGYRFVVDFRELNKLTIFDAHPLITTDEALESLGTASPSYFSVLDLQSGFYQLEIDPSSRPLTAWRCHMGLFQFKRLPMGLKNSPLTFQRVMEAVLRGLTWKTSLVYLDDVICFSKTFSDHLTHLREIFERLRAAGLKLHPSKCSFAKKEIKYLGHVVNGRGIHPNPETIETITSYPVPKNLKSLRAFLGTSGYYRRFCRDYSKIAKPLYDLTKKGVDFIWSEECQRAFDQLKKTLSSPPLLGYPQYDKPFRLYTDASSFSIGAILCQMQNGEERIISYAGRTLSASERNYGISELECLALVYAIKHYDCFLRHNKIEAYVDHSALKWLLSMNEPVGRFARWVALVQSYDLDIKYRPGKTHGNVDGISRRSYSENTLPQNDWDELPNFDCLASEQNSEKEKVGGSNEIIDNSRVTAEKLSSVKAAMDTNLWSLDEIREKQHSDSWYKTIIAYLKDGTLPDDNKLCRQILITHCYYVLENDILFHLYTQNKKRVKNSPIRLQICVPKSLVKTVLEETHDSLLTGNHMGIHRTLAKTRLSYYWPTLNADVIDWVKSCTLCCQRNRPQMKTKAKLIPMPVPNEPFQSVSTDILGPFRAAKASGNKYVLVFICYMTKYVELIPVQDIRAETVANAFIKYVICRHGICRVLHSDRGTNYLSNVVKETCKLLDIKKTQTTSFHPECNGQSERMMSTILNSLSKRIDDDEENWDRFLPYIQFSYNNSPCLDSSEYTPFFLIHGRYPRTLLDVNIDNFDIPVNARDYVISVMEGLEKAKETAVETLKERKVEMERKANKRTNECDFTVGDVVYVYRPVVTPGRHRKLLRPWVGPFYICQKLSPIHVKIRRKSDGKLIKNRVHVNRLKLGFLGRDRFFDPDPPDGVDAVEPVILADDEIPCQNEIDENNEQMSSQCTGQENDNVVYEIEKILRKKCCNNKWFYRVKWRNFDAKDNSWVEYSDLNPSCQEYVTSMHKNISTDPKSQKKE